MMTKILDVIALAQQLNAQQDEHRIIPVFWLASEDHDLAEVNRVQVYGELYAREQEG